VDVAAGFGDHQGGRAVGGQAEAFDVVERLAAIRLEPSRRPVAWDSARRQHRGARVSATLAAGAAMDVDEHVEYWRSSAAEDWGAAQDLLDKNRIRHALFFVHLSAEKLLKAVVTRRLGDVPPRTHNLSYLAELGGLQPPPEHAAVLAELNAFAIAGRYPDALGPPPSIEEGRRYLARASEVVEWLTSLLSTS
jgi:HEPN domain-containing protein